MDVKITKKQNEFMTSEAFETLFGGAAGGGVGAICGAAGGALVGFFIIEARYNE